MRLLDRATYLLRQPIPLRLLTDAAKDDDLAEEKRVLYVALTRARDRLILSGVIDARASIPDSFYRAYQSALRQRDDIECATIRHLLMKKAQPNLVDALHAPAPAGCRQLGRGLRGRGQPGRE